MAAARLPSEQSAFVTSEGKPTPQFYSFLNDLSLYFHVGTGAPAIRAPKGALYLRSDGSSSSTRAYINTDGAVAWTAVTTAT